MNSKNLKNTEQNNIKINNNELNNAEMADAKQRAIDIIKTDSEEAAYRRAKENECNPLNLLKDIMGLVFVAGIAFGWMILMLLILSFVSLSYLHFNIDSMINVSVVFAVICSAIYIFSKVRKSIVNRNKMS